MVAGIAVLAAAGAGAAGGKAVRVVSLAPAATEIVIALGLGDRLVAVDAASAPVPGAHRLPLADAASAAAFSPDLVLAPASEEEAVRRAVPRARVLPVAAHDFDDAWGLYHQIGAALGSEELARRHVREISRPLAEIGAASFGARRPRVAAVLTPEPLEIAGGHSFVTDVIELAGGESVTHGTEETVLRWTREQIVRAEPELVLLVGPREPTPDEIALVRARLGPGLPLETLVLDPERFWLHDAVPVVERVQAWIDALRVRDAAGSP